MISEINLDNVASYKSKSTLKTDKKVNIIYGLNGTGKSTFSNYLYDPGHERYNKCSNVNSNVSVLVYNKKFIEDNFYEAGKLKGIFSLSKENKQSKEKIESITRELEEIRIEKNSYENIINQENTKISEARSTAQSAVWKIKKDYSGGDRVLEYCLRNLMGSAAVLYNHITAIVMPEIRPTKTIANLKDEASAINGDAAIKQNHFDKIAIIELSSDDIDILGTIIVGNEDSPVAKLIDKLNNSDWVNNGLRYVKLTDDMKCPFCQSNTLTPKLVDEIKDYFDESYQLSIERLKKIKSDYSLFVSSIPNLNEYHQSPHSANYTMKLAKTHAKLMDIIKENNKLIEKKLKSPSLQIQLKDIHPPINDLNSIIDSINYLITENNNKIDNSKEELIKIKNEFWSILRYEYDQTISAFDTTSSKCNLIIIKNKTSLDEKVLEQNNKEAELIKLQKSTLNIKEAIDNINLGLTDLGITDFYIENYEDELYRIVRAGISMDVFSSLSEGEKMIISFLYFRELFKGKETATEVKQKKIAVIDDPVSSLSHIFVYNIGRLIKNDFFNSDNVEQVFVLTHSLYFFYELVDSNKDKRNESQKLFRLSKNTCGTSIETMKYEEIQNDYHSYWSVINDSNQPPALIANCMRNVVEYFFNFVQKADLSNVMQKKELQNIKFQSFIRYINRESHSLGQNIFDFKEFNYNDFKTALKLLFEHTGYPEHYEKMSKIKP
ncbi:Uncharacterized protein conserved in bacteria [Yersinia frederiksenii]|nr:Uncharacterized protein conserved in bacteria [Yersinia frederiksenii]